MKFTCPVCQTVYRIDDERFIKPVARSICRNCGSELSLNRKTGVVAATRKPAHAAAVDATDDSVGKRRPVTPFRAFPPPAQSGKRDFLAPGMLAAVIAAFVVALFYIADGMGALFTSRPAKTGPALRTAVAKQRPAAAHTPLQRTAAAHKPGQRSDAYIRKGFQLYKNGQLDKALQVFSSAVQQDPGSASAHFWRGRMYIKKKQYAEAAGDFAMAVKLNPAYSEAYDNLGWLAMQRGALDESLRYLNRSIQLKPANGWAYYNRGHIYFKRGRRKLALQDAKKACSLGYKAACRVYARYKESG